MFTSNDKEEAEGDWNKQFYRIDNDSNEEEVEGIEHLKEKFWNLYEKKNKLGEGTSGLVRRCIHKATGKEYAVKIVRTRDEEIIFHVAVLYWQLKNEFRNLKNMHHENVIEVSKLYIDNDAGYVYLVMEFFEGTEMFGYIEKLGNYSGTPS